MICYVQTTNLRTFHHFFFDMLMGTRCTIFGIGNTLRKLTDNAMVHDDWRYLYSYI